MFARNINWIRGNGSLMAVLGLLVMTLACATAPAPAPEAPALSEVRVEGDGDVTVVTFEGTAGAAVHSSQDDDPARVVVELAGVAPGSTAGAIAVYDGTVDEIMIEGDEAGTRIEIALGTVAAHELVPGEGAVSVHIARQDTMGMEAGDTLEVAESDDPWADVSEAPAAEPMEAVEEMAEPVAEVAPAAPATTLMAVHTREEGDGLVVELEGDGTIQDAEHFTLPEPLRLVVDLPGLVSQAPASTSVDGAMVSRVRVGQHDDKVRVVVDASEGVESFGEPQIGSLATGMALALGGASLPEMTEVAAEEAEADIVAMEEDAAEDMAAESAAMDDADLAMDDAASEPDAFMMAAEDEATEDVAMAQVEMAEEPVPAEMDDAMPMDEASAVQAVYGVQLESTDTHDRVVIVTDGPADYATLHPDAETVMIQVRGAALDEDAMARITPEKPGVVSMVAAFDQPEVATPEVRVVIQRATGVAPQVTQAGAMLTVEFMKTALAAPIPVMGAGPAMATSPVEPVPAAIDPATGIDMLAEGGLVDGKVYTGRRISLDFKDVDIDDVLRLIAEVSDLNVIAGDEVNGAVTIRLVDVPWDQALDVILLTKGLGFARVGNVLRIAPAEVLKAEEEARLQERRAKEKLEDLLVKLQPVNYADVKDVEKMVKRLLSSRGSVDVDERTNTIIIKDIAGVIDEATALIKAIDTQTPQVMIEAKIVEANLDFLREIGSLWAVGVNPRLDGFDEASDFRTGSTSPSAEGSDGFRLRPVQNPVLNGLIFPNNVAVGNPITELATGAINIGAFLLDERFDVDVQLEAAESHGEGKVISSPRIVTLDNRKASIEQGFSIPFQTFENGDAKLEFIDAVLRLDVTPHITADKSIIMEIEVQRNAPDDSVPTPTGSPAIAKNEAETETLVKDGQTLVIGGIYVVRQAERQSRVPYLHQIPVLGHAFKNNEVRDIRQELLVFVTPRIVVNPEIGH